MSLSQILSMKNQNSISLFVITILIHTTVNANKTVYVTSDGSVGSVGSVGSGT